MNDSLLPPAAAPSRCSPAAFRTLFRLNARAVQKTEHTLYLAVLRAQDKKSADALEKHIQKHMYHGELYCEMTPLLFYMQIYAPNEDSALIVLEDIADCVPHIIAHVSPVPK